MRNTGVEVVKSIGPAAAHGTLMKEGMKGSKTIGESKGNWMDNVDTKDWSDRATRERPNYGKSYQQMKKKDYLVEIIMELVFNP